MGLVGPTFLCTSSMADRWCDRPQDTLGGAILVEKVHTVTGLVMSPRSTRSGWWLTSRTPRLCLARRTSQTSSTPSWESQTGEETNPFPTGREELTLGSSRA